MRAYCNNGGCDFHNKPTGWEPGTGLAGRLAFLFQRLGGNISQLPPAEVGRRRPKLGENPEAPVVEIATSFPAMMLPAGSIPLLLALETDSRALPVGKYLIEKRSEVYLYPSYYRCLYWSPMYPKILRIAFLHHDRIVGYLDRDISVGEGPSRFKQRSAPDYLFGQHLVRDLPGEYVIVVESPMDAILLHGVAIRSSRPTQMQINFLLQCGKTPIMVPDLKDGEGLQFIEVAQQNHWPVAVPRWPGKIKDPGEAFSRLGVLGTAALIMKEKSINYDMMKLRVKIDK